MKVAKGGLTLVSGHTLVLEPKPSKNISVWRAWLYQAVAHSTLEFNHIMGGGQGEGYKFPLLQFALHCCFASQAPTMEDRHHYIEQGKKVFGSHKFQDVALRHISFLKDRAPNGSSRIRCIMTEEKITDIAHFDQAAQDQDNILVCALVSDEAAEVIAANTTSFSKDSTTLAVFR